MCVLERALYRSRSKFRGGSCESTHLDRRAHQPLAGKCWDGNAETAGTDRKLGKRPAPRQLIPIVQELDATDLGSRWLAYFRRNRFDFKEAERSVRPRRPRTCASELLASLVSETAPDPTPIRARSYSALRVHHRRRPEQCNPRIVPTVHRMGLQKYREATCFSRVDSRTQLFAAPFAHMQHGCSPKRATRSSHPKPLCSSNSILSISNFISFWPTANRSSAITALIVVFCGVLRCG